MLVVATITDNNGNFFRKERLPHEHPTWAAAIGGTTHGPCSREDGRQVGHDQAAEAMGLGER